MGCCASLNNSYGRCDDGIYFINGSLYFFSKTGYEMKVEWSDKTEYIHSNKHKLIKPHQFYFDLIQCAYQDLIN